MWIDPTSDNFQLSEPTLAPSTELYGHQCSDLDRFDPKIRQFIAAAIAPNTQRAYASDIEHFRAWGGCVPAAPETIARYLADHAQILSTATLGRRLAAIGRAHTIAGCPNPAANDLVRITLRGIRRTYGRPQCRVAALTKEHLIAVISGLGSAPKDVRDRALLLIGFAGAFRRSELIAVDCKSIERRSAGIVISLRKSKTDQDRRGREVAIPYAQGAICPIRALDVWLDLANIADGPVFRPVTKHGDVLPRQLSGEAVAVIVKQRTRSIVCDSARYSGHSLRAGFVTSAAMADVPVWKIKAQTGHASDAALGRYIRSSGLFAGNAVSKVL
jgi:integrase